MTKLTLRRGKEESLLRRHPWIFSGAIHSTDNTPEEGDVVEVYTASGEFIARGHCAIGSIAVRVLTFDPEEVIDSRFWERRIAEAYGVRKTLGLTDSSETTCYRLIHGEGDNLPGLVVDIYGTTAVMQAHSVGMYLARHEIAAALRSVYGTRLTAVYDKSSGTIPPKCGIEAVDGYLWQETPNAHPDTVVWEGGNRFQANWEDGQKTGFFIDQRENRALVGHYARGRRVLNTFCYTGGFSVYAMQGGATAVDSVDSSARAVALASENMELNRSVAVEGFAHQEIASDTLEFIRRMPENAYDLVILDPPAFAKHHKVLGNALQGYKRLNAAALGKMPSGSILFTFSCSQAVSREQFRMAVFSAAAIAERRVRILHQLTQPADHPINIYHPEGEYLKGLVLYVE